ncbi:MAG: extracellular solute-binding protein [Chitinivibrionales bacterium]|nr:extracellular solute-binding protein [Chitinivibrionales bacterium]
MQQMFRFIVCALIAASLSFAPSARATAASTDITLTVLNYLDITSPSGKVFDTIVNQFSKKYPNIKLKIENYFNEPFHQKTAALAASGQLPDVVYMWPGGRSEAIIKNELVQDLYPFLGDIKNQFIPSTVAPQFKGKLMELPGDITASHVFYINKALLKKLGLTVPKTYEELLASIPKIKAAGLEPLLMANKDTWVNQSCLFSMVVGRMVSTTWLQDAIAGKASFTDKPFVDALKFIKRLYDDGILTKSGLMTEYAQIPNLFAAEKSPYLIDGDWRVSDLVPLIPAAKQSDFQLSIFPAIPGEINHTTTSVVNGCGFGMNAKLTGEKAKAAFTWILFFSGLEGSMIRMVRDGIMPSYKIDPSQIQFDPLAQQRIGFFSGIGATPVLDNVIGSKPIDILNNTLQEIGLGTTTPEQAATKIETAMKAERNKK